MKPVRIYVLIADGGRARLLLQEGRGKEPRELSEFAMSADDLPERHVERERPGRVHDSVGPGRHAVEPRTTHERQDEMDFARHVVERVDGLQQEFDRLIIVAAPKTLGDIRNILPSSLSKKVTSTLAKDLTKIPTKDLVTHLDELLPM